MSSCLHCILKSQNIPHKLPSSIPRYVKQTAGHQKSVFLVELTHSYLAQNKKLKTHSSSPSRPHSPSSPRSRAHELINSPNSQTHAPHRIHELTELMKSPIPLLTELMPLSEFTKLTPLIKLMNSSSSNSLTDLTHSEIILAVTVVTALALVLRAGCVTFRTPPRSLPSSNAPTPAVTSPSEEMFFSFCLFCFDSFRAPAVSQPSA